MKNIKPSEIADAIINELIDKIIPNVEYVPAGIAEIVEKQEEGWSYIKGGF